MTLLEFESKRHEIACARCNATGLEIEHNVNNMGARARCPHCGATGTRCLPGKEWLPKNDATSRRPRRPAGEPSGPDVWEANGNVCAFCSITAAECAEYGMGLTAQHIVPVFMGGGGTSPLIPFCSRCQQASLAAQEAQRRIREKNTPLWDIIRRIEKYHPELLGEDTP
jgi:hypothetical protein